MIKLLVPNVPPLDAIVPYLKQVHENKWFTNFGKLTEELEDRLSRHFHGASVVTVSSGTAGLELAYELWRGYGEDAVDISAYTFPATALAARRAGLHLILKDVSPHTWSNGSVAAFGLPAYGGPVVDAAAAFGEQHAGRDALTVFSMHATKPLPAIEGGFIVTHNTEEASELRRMTNFGFLESTRTARYQRGHAVPQGFGTNAKLSEYHAAVALASLDAWPETRERFLRLYDWYSTVLPKIVETQVRPRGVYPVLAVKLPLPAALKVGAALAEEGIETRRWYCPPLYRHPFFKAEPSLFPCTQELVYRVIGLPWHLELTLEDVEKICAALRKVLKENQNG